MGAKAAVSECVPTDSDEVVVWATPPETVTAEPIWVAPSKNLTVPAAADGVTVAFNVTTDPDVTGLAGVTARAVVVVVAGDVTVKLTVLDVDWV